MALTLLIILLPISLSFSISSDDQFLVECAKMSPVCREIMREPAPAFFETRINTTKGSFTVHVNSSVAPPMAQRFYILSKLAYFNGGPFYRVLRLPSAQFVAQFGYRAVPTVDQAWIALQTLNDTVFVRSPANIRGTVAFGTGEVPNTGQNPNCTALFCSQGFSVELFVNLDNNTRLDPCAFSPFGTISMSEMDHVFGDGGVFAGYGECANLCGNSSAAADPYCIWDAQTHTWRGVDLDKMIDQGHPYLAAGFPRFDYVLSTEVIIV
jgi:cyclophilin family peptidyl-prolyl cis-trans isomerase